MRSRKFWLIVLAVSAIIYAIISVLVILLFNWDMSRSPGFLNMIMMISTITGIISLIVVVIMTVIPIVISIISSLGSKGGSYTGTGGGPSGRSFCAYYFKGICFKGHQSSASCGTESYKSCPYSS